VNLPDGSRVWLDAASSIQFPTAFTGPSRDVSVTGEAYMEIARDAHRPFHATVKDMRVSVLGTQFNISAYPNEPVKTTLIQGSVEVSQGSDRVTLKPGQQAESQNSLKVYPDMDVEAITAWKEGLFVFNHASIEVVMTALSRWYDVDVRYEGPQTDHKITAVMRRDSYASKNLEILTASGYHFRIEGKTIVVLP